jgi:tRNA U34 2-thiouridine synthase MnmA/TrmU
VVVGSGQELARADVALGDLNWLDTPPEPGERLLVRIRHRGERVRATVVSRGDDELALRLDAAQRAVTPGQSGALYRDEGLVGGGRIR